MSFVNEVQDTARNETIEQVYKCRDKTAAKLVKLVQPLLHCGHIL